MKIAGLILFLLCLNFVARADDAPFDLDGPRIDVYVTRGQNTLPISQVPSLQSNDVLHIQTDLPVTQSNHLLLIVAFLSDATNEPPDNWFTKIETWKPSHVEGETVSVPDGARYAFLFVAPETGGDFSTLRSAVKGNPGVFIRANISLNKASLEQQRIERYLTSMRAVAQEDSQVIAARSAQLASALALNPNADCFRQPVADQVNCLTQVSTPLLLDDGHGQSIATAISSGASSDFINEASTASNGGAYSPYVGTLIDLVRLVGTLHTAQYHYIPAIGFPQQATLNLKLNSPPSFHSPKSVIVVALPLIENESLPRIRLSNPSQIFCLRDPAVNFPLRGSPLVFSTGFAHHMTLEIDREGSPLRVSVVPDALAGGLIIQDDIRRMLLVGTSRMNSPSGQKAAAKPLLTVLGKLRGYWGFETFESLPLSLQQIDGGEWRVAGTEQFIAGQDAHLMLRGSGTGCISKVTLASRAGISQALKLKAATTSGNTDELPLDIAMKGYPPGLYSLSIEQYGGAQPIQIPLRAFDAAVHFDRLVTHPSDNTALLMGAGVENVALVVLGGLTFVPSGPGGNTNSLQLRASGKSAGTSATQAIVTLTNGCTVSVPALSQEAGADLQLISFHVTRKSLPDEVEVSIANTNDIPVSGELEFVVHTRGAFPRMQTIELANPDGSMRKFLSLKSDNLILQDQNTVVGTVDLAKAFGESAFGTLRMRAVPADGIPGEWVVIGRMVRTPRITAVRCSDVGTPACIIEGRQFFMALELSTTRTFENAVPVPTGFDGPTFSVPMKWSSSTSLYLKLRDDPNTIATIRLPVGRLHRSFR